MATLEAKEFSLDFDGASLEQIAREADKRADWLDSYQNGSVRDSLYLRDAMRFRELAAGCRQIIAMQNP